MNALIKVKFIHLILMSRSCLFMKRKRDLEDNELLPFKRRHIEDDKGKEEDISDSSEDILVEGLSSKDDSSEADEACGSEQLYQEQLPPLFDPFNSIMFKYLSDRDLENFSQACNQTRAWTSHELYERKKIPTSTLLLSVVQGNETEVKRLLNPGLVCSAIGKATDYSNRLIQDLTPFQAALCAGDVEMCEIMKECFFQLDDGQAEMERQFNEVFPDGLEAHVQTQQDNVFDFNEILQAIIRASDNEVTAALNKEFDNNLALHLALEKFRKAFTEKSLSETVFNPYHLLKAFETFDAEYDHLGNWDNSDKRNLFWRQVIGFVQRSLPACYLQAFAQGIYYILENKEPLRRSFDFRWGGDTILPPRDFSGLGFDFACWSCVAVKDALAAAGAILVNGPVLEIMCQAKTSSLEKLLRPIQRCKRELGV
jgi:hypothetical protein